MSVDVSACLGAAPRWEDYGIPCPAIDGFDYEIDAGLIRTPMDTGHARQRRRYTDRPTRYQLTWMLSTAQLHAWEALLDKAYDWIYVPMVTGQVPRWMAVDHLIRFISNPKVSLQAKDLWQVTVEAEQYEIDPACVFEQMCDEIAKCLDKPLHYGYNVSWDQFWPHWGDETYWGNPNG